MTNAELAGEISVNVATALREDLGSGDVTAVLVPDDTRARAILRAREPITMAGQPWFNEVFRQLDPEVNVEWLFNDGDKVSAESELCIMSGPARSILSGERTALNFLQTLSSTATLTAKFVAAIAEHLVVPVPFGHRRIHHSDFVIPVDTEPCDAGVRDQPASKNELTLGLSWR